MRPTTLSTALPAARTLFASAAALLLLAGCASVELAPPPAPAALAPAAWQVSLPAAPDAPLADWWQRFDDPLLPELVRSALAASPDVAAAATSVARARAALASADTAAGPRAGLGADGAWARNVPQTAAMGQGRVGVQAEWELDLFGGLGAAREAAGARALGAEAAWHGARVAVAAQTGESLLALRACQARREQTALDAASRAETARLTELSARAGFTAPADAALARAGAAQAAAQLKTLDAQCATLTQALAELSAQPEPALRQRLAARAAALPQPGAIAVPLLPAQALAQRPDVFEAARAVVAAAGDRVETAAGDRPRVQLSGNVGLGLARMAGGGSSSGPVWSLGPLQVIFPALDGSARRAAGAAAQAAYDEAVLRYQAQLRRALREVESALVALQAAAERERDVRIAAEGFESALSAVAARQRAGLASLFELEDARRSAVAAQLGLIELQRERAAAWIDLYRALGGGWQEGAAGPAFDPAAAPGTALTRAAAAPDAVAPPAATPVR